MLITGSSSGIGEAMTRTLAANGHAVVLCARRAGRLGKIVAEVRAKGGVAEFRKFDVADRTDVAAFANFAKQKLGRIHVIFKPADVGVNEMIIRTVRSAGHAF